MGKNILAVLAGLAGAVVVVYLVELLGMAIFPVPENIDFNNAEAVSEMMSKLPAGSLIFVIVAWALGSFTGGTVASIVASSNQTALALVVGGILMIAGIVNLIMIPHPAWFWIAGILVYLPFAYAGSRFVAKSKIS